MVAYEIPGLRFSLPAGAAIERGRFISVNSSGNGVAATAATQVVGASMNKTKSGEVLEVADGIVMVEASGTVASGAAVYADADGKATTTEGTANVAGIALTAAAAAGDIIAVKM